MLLRIFLSLCVLLAASNCNHGLKATVCVVDAAAQGFQCSYDGGKGYFISLKEGEHLLCASITDAENVLKACKEKKQLPITLCTYIDPSFHCVEPTGQDFELSVKDADNYFCLSPKDRRRLLERCR